MAMSHEAPKPAVGNIGRFILKVASRCNLNCPYCYVYNKADSSWKERPYMMSDEIFELVLERIRNHCLSTGQSHCTIVFHGGEPCLIGPARLDAWCKTAREALQGLSPILKFSIQTNGTLLDDAWAEVFRRHSVSVGISLDGPKEINDVSRVDHKGQGSYDQVERGIRVLQNAGIPYGILSVIALGADPLTVHRHFMALGCKSVTYVLPHFTHDTIAPIREMYGATPCADFLIPVFDDWWFNATPDINIGDLRNIARIILGGSSYIETLGNSPPLYVFIESDGSLEGLDNLRACKDGIARINLNVRQSGFQEILKTDTMHRTAIFEGMPLPTGCRNCVEKDTCAGGYLPHRYSAANGFDNPSVWCADLLKLFGHIRSRLGVTVEETYARRQALEEVAAVSVVS
jgi:uncharacterized protein